MGSDYKIGVASCVITPPLGTQMAGFDARKGVSTGVHDDLHARAMVFTRDGVQAAIVSVEVIAVSREFSARTRTRIEQETGIPAASIVLSATHTHCGPVTLNHFFNQGQPLDEVYLDGMSAACCMAVKTALQALAPRRLRTGFAVCDGLAFNRRTPDAQPTDPQVGVLLAEEFDGAPYAIAVNFACHTTVLGPNTLEFTADFPAFTLDRLRTQLGAEALFFNGAEGDLSIGHKSDLSAVGVIDPYRTFETARQLGERLADSVLEAVPALVQETGPLAVHRTEARLPLKPCLSTAEATVARIVAGEAMEAGKALPLIEQVPLRQRSLFARIEEYYASLYAAADGDDSKWLTVELTAIRLGETVLLSLPGEIFVAVALGIRKDAPWPRTFFLGLADDYIGYLPSEGADAAGGYEVVASRVRGDAWRNLHSASLALLQGLREEEKGVRA